MRVKSHRLNKSVQYLPEALKLLVYFSAVNLAGTSVLPSIWGVSWALSCSSGNCCWDEGSSAGSQAFGICWTSESKGAQAKCPACSPDSFLTPWLEELWSEGWGTAVLWLLRLEECWNAFPDCRLQHRMKGLCGRESSACCLCSLIPKLWWKILQLIFLSNGLNHFSGYCFFPSLSLHAEEVACF